jgi:hypothetical protein
MSVDLDRDDEIGARMRALEAWTPDGDRDAAWSGVATVAGAALVGLAIGGVAAVIGRDGDRDSVEVITPAPTPSNDAPLFRVLTPAEKSTQISVVESAPYRAGQEVRVLVTSDELGDAINEQVSLCYPWLDGETCDPIVTGFYDDSSPRYPIGGQAWYALRLPGWVNTPEGLQSCEELGCRIAIRTSGTTRIGTPPLEIESGPKPASPARLVAARVDGVVRVEIDGLRPDPSYTAWAANATPEQLRDMPPGWIELCVFDYGYVCDGFIDEPRIEFDGEVHTVDLRMNRKLFTFEGWVDCVEVTCAVVLHRAVNVQALPGGTGSSTDYAAIVPFRLPANTPEMQEPTIRVDFPDGRAVDARARVTVENVPTYLPVDGFRQLGGLGLCAADDLRVVDDCRYDTLTEWSTIVGGQMEARIRISPCGDSRGCYFALQVGGKGYPELARTERFTPEPS